MTRLSDEELKKDLEIRKGVWTGALDMWENPQKLYNSGELISLFEELLAARACVEQLRYTKNFVDCDAHSSWCEKALAEYDATVKGAGPDDDRS